MFRACKEDENLAFENSGSLRNRLCLRPCLYGLGYPRQPSPRVTLSEQTFHSNLWKIPPAVYMILPVLSRGARKLGWASCLISAGRVTLAGGKTFSYINDFGSATRDNSRRTKCHVFSKFQVLKHNFTLQKQNKLNKAHTDRMDERNSNEERYLAIWILKRFMN